MFALLKILCVSVLSCFSFNNYHSDDIVCIEKLDESHPIQNLGYYNEYGVQLFMSKPDFYSPEIFVTFIRGISEDINNNYQSIGFQNPNSYQITFTNCDGEFRYLPNGRVPNARFSALGSIVVSKTAFTTYNVEGESYYTGYYFIVIADYSDDNIMSISYAVSIPFYNDAAHELANVMVTNVTMTYGSSYTSALGNNAWVYFENSLNEKTTPYITYYYPHMNDEYYRGFNTGYDTGYVDGWSAGYQEGSRYTGGVASEIIGGIFSVAMLPVNVFLTILNFEVYGINIAGIVTGTLTVALLIIIIRFLFGGKGGSND